MKNIQLKSLLEKILNTMRYKFIKHLKGNLKTLVFV